MGKPTPVKEGEKNEKSTEGGAAVAAPSSAPTGGSDVKELDPLPAYIERREKLWQKWKAEYLAELEKKPRNPIKVRVGSDENEKVIDGVAWETSPLQVARQLLSKSATEKIVISKVNGQLWDLERPLEGDCQLELLDFEDDEAKAVFWHSSAHVLGEAMERIYGGKLCYGPPIESGFYYDMFLELQGGCGCSHGSDAVQASKDSHTESGDEPQAKSAAGVSSAHFGQIENVMKKITKENQPFERLELTKEQLLEMFDYNQFKGRIINEKIPDPKTTVYKCGTLIDLCRGPHVRHTGHVKAFKVTKSSSSLWEGKVDAETLQRVYGISFPDPKQLKEWQKFQEEAAKRDHRKIGREQGLFMFHELSPGSCFFTPRGAIIYNTLVNFIKQEYWKRGFEEIITPNIYNSKLWEKSGHWQHYSQNMFSFECEKEIYALKPMNCPGHCLLFDSTTRSWRDLPIRFADFGVLHRNEISGALTGLTRVRRFQQDDAHIFCRKDQIEQEIINALGFMKDVYSIFGFTFDLCLSTRPDSYLGEKADWDQAEEALKNALNSFCKDLGLKWKLNPGDGAFYGPKIDITVSDALRRPHQCATIQLDFQLPIRFDLSYAGKDQAKERPVIVHRAILGSVERFIAILTENYAGKWPFWLSPRQAMVITPGSTWDPYAISVQQKLREHGFRVDVELDPGLQLPKKVRNAQLAQYNFILVVGAKEQESGTVNVRTRDNKQHGEKTIDYVVAKFRQFNESKTANAEQEFGESEE